MTTPSPGAEEKMRNWLELIALLVSPLPIVWGVVELIQIFSGEPVLLNVPPIYAPWVVAMALERWFLIVVGIAVVIYCTFDELKKSLEGK